jgi:predicted  nucleic acid-binding Zn-ribbon protein
MLMELQKLDTELYQLEKDRGDLPRQVGLLKRELDSKQALLEEKRSQVLNNHKERDMNEMEIRDLEEKQKKYQSQLFSVKTNREYDAVTHEIESVKQSVESREGRILELMDMEEEGKKHIEAITQELETLKKRYESKKAQLDKQMKRTEKRELEIRDKRNNLLHRLKPQTAAAYKRILNGKNGLAVVPIVRNACGGCQRTLPPQRVLEVRQMNRLYVCDMCGRILIWDDKVSGVAE